MREIKFRVWIDRIGHMLYSDEFDSLFNFLGELSDDFGLMQYTGLKDKNGKEIYESDIVARDDSRETHEIIFEHGSFKEKGSTWLYSTSWEIIGNIYENPELL